MIIPVAFNSPNLTLACRICGWLGDVSLASLAWGQHIDGTPDRHLLVLPCGNPTCGSVSVHPIGGGARPRAIQALFIIKLMQDQGISFLTAKAAVKQAAENMDFVGRFRWASASTTDDLVITSGE